MRQSSEEEGGSTDERRVSLVFSSFKTRSSSRCFFSLSCSSREMRLMSSSISKAEVEEDLAAGLGCWGAGPSFSMLPEEGAGGGGA
jgi:hypothetical protein